MRIPSASESNMYISGSVVIAIKDWSYSALSLGVLDVLPNYNPLKDFV